MDATNDRLYAPMEVFQQYLQPDEDVLWTGRPDPNILFTAADRFLVPFSLLWAGFALFWEGSVIYALLQGETKSGNGGDLRFFAVVGLIGAAVGLYLILGRFIYKRLRKKSTSYAVTTRRALSVTKLRNRHLESASIDQISFVEKTESKNGVGSLQFREGVTSTKFLDRVKTHFARQGDYGNTGLELFGSKAGYWEVSFYDIHNVEEVYSLVEALREKQHHQA